MAARRMKGAWWVDFRFRGERIRKKSPVDTKRGAEEYERQERQRHLDGKGEEKEVPTFADWFWGDNPGAAEPTGRYWAEWVVGRKNKHGTAESKRSTYQIHLKERFGKMRLDEIDLGEIASFRAALVEKNLREKSINNILAILSKPLRYAADVGIIASAPKVGLFRVEAKEIETWEFEHYARLLDAARTEGEEWHVAACLAGEAGLRIGEIRALRWREDVDLVGESVTVNMQMRHGVAGTPKGRTRRTVPMTATLRDALKGLSTIRTGYVVRNLDGSPVTDGQTTHTIYRICRRAGLPERGWHALRHAFGTHSALFGVNPWRLMTWMGHKRIDQTMNYVHVAEAHRREWPACVHAAAGVHADPDRRILAMLAARASVPRSRAAAESGHLVGTEQSESTEGAHSYS